MPQKRRTKPREIEASRLVLRDAKGEVRILLDAGGDDGYATICVFSTDGRGSMQIGTQPSGDVVMSFDNGRMVGKLTLSQGGLVLRANDGRLGVVLGPIVDGRDDVTVFRDGQPVWTSHPQTSRGKASRPARKRKPKSGGAAGA